MSIGNRIAASILAGTIDDGANETGGYVDPNGYQPINPPMTVDYPGVLPPDSSPLENANRWQPLYVNASQTQNGLIGKDLQEFIGPHWGSVTPFALNSNDSRPSWHAVDPGPMSNPHRR